MWNSITGFFNKIDELFFSLDLSQYDYLDKGISPLNNIPKIIFALAVGLIIALIVTYYHKSILGSLVRAIAEQGARDESSAVPLDRISPKHASFFARALRRDAVLKKYVKFILDGDNQEPHEKSAVYLIAEKEEEGLRRYSEKGSDIRYLIVSIVCTVVVTALILSFRNEIAFAVNAALKFAIEL